jgi:aspartyl-tRNA(Asn)/glutamyl-tRNA(Gln) amidotransferase subunit A
MNINRLTIHETKEALNNGKISTEELVNSYIDHIKKTDPKVDAFLLNCWDQAKDKAKKIDQDNQINTNPLSGIPYAMKDNICTKDITTTAASKMLYNFIPPYSADVYERLNDVNSIMLGKVNMDEFAMGSSTENSAFKITKNPWDLSRVPGGSSGGSAVAVASDMAAFALGSDTGGSIRQPASLCGVVGLKPTYGLVSRYGLIAFASSLDQIGTFTKDVEDAAIVLNAIAGHDPKDSTSLNLPKKDYFNQLKKGAKEFTIGILKNYKNEGVQEEVQTAMDDAIAAYKSMGAKIVEVDFRYFKQALAAYYIIACAEASSNLARYDGVRYGFRAKDYTDYIDMYYKTRSEGFGSEVKRRIMLGTYALSSGYYDAYYKKAMQVRTVIINEYKKIFDQCDVLLTPTSATTAFKIGEKMNDPLQMYMSDTFTVPINIAGIPAISIPAELDRKGLPIGLQIVGPVLGEEKILQAAWALENYFDFRKNQPNL